MPEITIICSQCKEEFPHTVTRGRKPSRCPDCREAFPQGPPPPQVNLVASEVEADYREEIARLVSEHGTIFDVPADALTHAQERLRQKWVTAMGRQDREAA